MKVTYTNTKLEVMPNIVTDPKKMIIEYLQQLDLTQFVPYDSDNNQGFDTKTGTCMSYSFSYEEIESGIYTSEQDKKDGIKPFKYKFPMFSLGAGYSYGLLKI